LRGLTSIGNKAKHADLVVGLLPDEVAEGGLDDNVSELEADEALAVDQRAVDVPLVVAGVLAGSREELEHLVEHGRRQLAHGGAAVEVSSQAGRLVEDGMGVAVSSGNGNSINVDPVAIGH